MKKTLISALVLIMTVSLAGCWRKPMEPTTAPSTVGPTIHTTEPSTKPSTVPTAPATTGTIPHASGSTDATQDGILPDMEGPTGDTGTGTSPTDNAAGNQARRAPRP